MHTIIHGTTTHHRWILLLLLALSAGIQAQITTPTEWGAVANGGHNDCPDDTCLLILPIVEEGNGDVNIPGTSYNLTNSRGTINSSVTINGGLSVPQLTAFANSNLNSLMQAAATGVQGYTYTAASAGKITLAATLTGTITNPDADTSTGLAAHVCLVPDNGTFFFTNAAFTCLLSTAPPASASASFEVTSNGAVNQTKNVEIDLTPGDGFYVVATMSATAAGTGAIADAANTLTMEFTIANPGSDPDPAISLTPAYSESVNVPMLPLAASLALFLFIILLAKNQYRLNF
jgi:hypothetical protein